jgi:uncharacterized protein YaaQ
MIKDPGNNLMLIAVVQAQDAEGAQNALEQLGISSERLPSVGGFLGRRNATLLIGLPVTRQQAVVDALNENCRQRVEYIAVPLESAPLPLPTPTPITIGGATIFGLEVDHYEEL